MVHGVMVYMWFNVSKMSPEGSESETSGPRKSYSSVESELDGGIMEDSWG